MVRHIKNTCPNNQMRDVDFTEIETDSPENYVRSLLHGKDVEVSAQYRDDGSVTVHACCDGLIQEFVFTPV